MPWEIVLRDSQVLAIHIALLSTGEVLYFGGDEHSCSQFRADEFDRTRVWNPETGEVRLAPSPFTDIFCCGHAILGDGRVLIGGGTQDWPPLPDEECEDPTPDLDIHEAAGHFTGHKICWAFQARTRTWQRVADMGDYITADSGGRWYPTLVTLADGRVLAVSGHPGPGNPFHEHNSPEIYDASTNRWTEPFHVDFNDTTGIHCRGQGDGYYPRLHTMPSGNVLIAKPVGLDTDHDLNKAFRMYSPQTGRFVGPRIAPPPMSGEFERSSVFTERTYTTVLLPLLPGDDYRPHVLLVGPERPVRWTVNENDFLDDADSPSTEWQAAGSRQWSTTPPARHNFSAVLLPTGEVFVCGGVRGEEGVDGDGNTFFRYSDSTAVREGEIYSPGIDWDNGVVDFDGEQWQTVERAEVPRNYHSTALLLPSGRVLTAGSNKNASRGNRNSESTTASTMEFRFEVYRPWYDDARDRPEIAESPGRIVYGERFLVASRQAEEIRRVALVRAGSATHSFDSDQRYVGLEFTLQASGLLNVTAPPHGGVAPPGTYMLWIIDREGRPCERAALLQLSACGQLAFRRGGETIAAFDSDGAVYVRDNIHPPGNRPHEGLVFRRSGAAAPAASLRGDDLIVEATETDPGGGLAGPSILFSKARVRQAAVSMRDGEGLVRSFGAGFVDRFGNGTEIDERNARELLRRCTP